jgi:hypothetical protein
MRPRLRMPWWGRPGCAAAWLPLLLGGTGAQDSNPASITFAKCDATDVAQQWCAAAVQASSPPGALHALAK